MRQFQPALVSVRDGDKAAQLRELLKGAPRQPEILVGEEGICAGGCGGQRRSMELAGEGVAAKQLGCFVRLAGVAAGQQRERCCME